MGNTTSSTIDGNLVAPIIVLSFLSAFLLYSKIVDTFTIPNQPHNKKEDINNKDSKDGKLTLYLLGGGKGFISSSPFSSKLALYARLTGIPHYVTIGDVRNGNY